MRAALLAAVLLLPAAVRAGGPAPSQPEGNGDGSTTTGGDDSAVCPVPAGGITSLDSIMKAPLPGTEGKQQERAGHETDGSTPHDPNEIVVTARRRETPAEPATVGVNLASDSKGVSNAATQPQPSQTPLGAAPAPGGHQDAPVAQQGAGLGGMMRTAGTAAGNMANSALGWLRLGKGQNGAGSTDASGDGSAGVAPGGATRTEGAARSQAKALSTLNAVGGQLVGESAAMQTDGVGGGGAGPGGAARTEAMPNHGGPHGIPGGFTGLESTSILARGRMRRALEDEGLTGTMRDGQPDIRGRDGRQASKQQLDALLARYKNEPAALNGRPDFLDVLPPSHYDELRKRFPRDARDPSAPIYRGMALAGGKDFLWASGPQRGQDISPETLEGAFRALPRLPGAKLEESVPGTPVAEADPAQAETIQVAPGTDGYQVTGLKADALEPQAQSGGVYAGGLGAGRGAERAEMDVVGRGLSVKSVPSAGGRAAAEEPLPIGKIVAGGAAVGFLFAAGLLALKRRGV